MAMKEHGLRVISAWQRPRQTVKDVPVEILRYDFSALLGLSRTEGYFFEIPDISL